MQIKNKQLEGFRDLTASHTMVTSEDLLISASGIAVGLPIGKPGEFFSAIRNGDWTGSTTYSAPAGFTVEGWNRLACFRDSYNSNLSTWVSTRC